MIPARALIVGGSLGGLFAALLLRRAGWVATVLERSSGTLASRGAGIVTHAELVDAIARAGADDGKPLGVEIAGRLVLDRDGNEVCRMDLPQTMTSWDRVYRMLRQALPDECHRPGAAVAAVEQDADGVTARLAHGERVTGELLVAADGIHSTVRAQLLPEAVPAYTGYVAWRGLVEESRLSAATRAALGDRLSFTLPPGEQMLGYPVAGADEDVRPGRRRYNFVWYRPAREEDELVDLMTDASGTRHAPSIPHDRIRAGVIARMRADADRLLAPQFAEVVAVTATPFLQPIHDLESARLAVGRVALLGDAAFVARPHLGMGVTKVAGDAVALADALLGGGDLAAALADYETGRLRFGRAAVSHGRRLGAHVQARLLTEDERRSAATHRDPARVMAEVAAPGGGFSV